MSELALEEREDWTIQVFRCLLLNTLFFGIVEVVEEEGTTPRLVLVEAEGFSSLRAEERFSLGLAVVTAEVVEENLGLF